MQDLIDRLRLAQPKPHTPVFAVVKQGDYYIVSDGPKPIAVVVRDLGVGGALLDVLAFSPWAKPRPLHLPPHLYHYATRLGYGASFNWSVDRMFQRPDRHDTLRLVVRRPERLVFLHAGEFKEGSTVSARLEIGYDAGIGQYSYDFTWDIASTRNVVGEFCNVYHANLMHSDMQQREYDYGCYVRAGGRWEKYPITIMVTGQYHKRLNGVPLALGGGAGHLNRNGVVPMIVHRHANVPLHVGSCDTCFDLHQSARVKAGLPARISSRFADLGPVVAAHPDELRLIEVRTRQAFPFHLERVCNFAETISTYEPWSGGIWDPRRDKSWQVVDGIGHSGTRSLCLTAKPGRPAQAIPYGPAFAFDNGRDYEVTAWVKVEGNARTEAAVELSAFYCTLANPAGIGRTSVFGACGWTRLTAVVHSGMADNGYLHLKLSGHGRAWFADILVRRLALPHARPRQRRKTK